MICLADRINVWIRWKLLTYQRWRVRFKPLVTSNKIEVLNQLAAYVKYRWPKSWKLIQYKTPQDWAHDEQVEFVKKKMELFNLLLGKAHFDIYGFSPTPEAPFPFEAVIACEDDNAH